MRVHSTPQSALNLEITRFAIIESAAAVILYVCIGIYFGTFRYLAVAVVAAPLMLLRTQFSAQWGLNIWTKLINRSFKWPKPKKRLFNRLYMICWVIAAPLIGISIRVFATLFWAFRRPLQTLKETPQNWLRQSFCTDFFHPPEIVPLEAVKGDPKKTPTFTGIIKLRKEDVATKNMSTKVLYWFLASSFLLIGYLPSIIYRISFKATVLAYAPLIWIVQVTLRSSLPVKMRLERITKGELEKVRRALSWIVLATLSMKIALFFNWIDQSYIVAKFPSRKIIDRLVVPDGWPWWQITLGADSLLTFFLFLFADAALSRIESQYAWKDKYMMETVSTVSFLRSILSIAAVSYFFYIAFIDVAPFAMFRLLVD